MAVEVAREQALAEGQRVLDPEVLQPAGAPCLVRRLDDEGRGLAVVLVGVRLEPAVRRMLEREREGVELFRGAQPHEAAVALLDLRLVDGRVARADAAVDAVGGQHQVGPVAPRQFQFVHDRAVEQQPHAELLAARLQDGQQALARDAAESVAAGDDGAAPEMDGNVVPVVEGVQDGAGGGRIGRLQVAQRLVRKHHAPAEGVVTAVAFDHRHLVRRIVLLEQQCGIQAGRSPSHAHDLHCGSGCLFYSILDEQIV